MSYTPGTSVSMNVIYKQCDILEQLADSLVETNSDLPDLPEGSTRTIEGYRRVMPDGKLYDMVVIWKHAEIDESDLMPKMIAIGIDNPLGCACCAKTINVGLESGLEEFRR
jgi:hypothetical protein